MGVIDDIIIKLSGGKFSIAGLLNVSAGSIVTEKDKFITSKGVTKVIQITKMPYHYTGEVLTDITRGINKMDSKIVVNSYIESDRVSIPVNHPTYVSKLNKATRNYHEIKSMYDSLDDIHKKAGVLKHNGRQLKSFDKDTVLKAKHASESYTEVRNNIKRNGAVYFLSRIFIHITFPDNESASTHYEPIFSFIESATQSALRVNKKMGTYLLNMSPSVTNVQHISAPNVLTSHESLANLIPYRSRGLISTKGILLGTDVQRDSPFYLDTYSTDEGSSVLISAGAGSGKTVFGYHFSLQSMANDTTSIYLDLKGGTISKALKELMNNFEVINFSGVNAKFINPLILDVVNKEYSMRDAISTTSAWLALMVDLQPGEGSSLDLENILKAAIRGYYSSMKVTEGNAATYSRTKEMTLGKIVEFLGTNAATSDNAEEKKLYEVATKRISALLHEYGMDRNENAIDITTLYDRDAIIFDFDKDKEVTLGRIDKIRIFSVIFFTKQMSAFNKRNERFTNLFADEGNQYIYIPGLMEYISDLTARARSSNTSVIFLTNDLSVVSKPEMSGFMSNIAVFIVGRSVSTDLKILENITDSDMLLTHARRINKHPGKYSHSFAVYSTLNGHPVNAIVRADLPKDIVKAFSTRTVVV